jgi:putative membrane protein
MAAILATVFGALAALIHVYIFVMESVQWTTPRVWRRFGVPDQQSADTIRPMAYNQGFYNLFLAIGALLGLVLLWAGGPGSAPDVADVAGRTLALFALGSMVAASLVLLTSGARYLRPALVQGVAPLLGFVFLLFV